MACVVSVTHDELHPAPFQLERNVFVTEESKDFSGVFAHFAATDFPTRSIYAWAPVFPCRVGEKSVVVKRTRGDAEAAAAVAGWTTDLAQAGVPVVSPVPLPVSNPAPVEGDYWVAYPFIDGDVYTGKTEQIADAGRLLGRIHAVSTATTPPLFEWPDHDEESVREDQEGIEKVLSGPTPDVVSRLSRLVEDFMPTVLPAIRHGDLPTVGAVMDYKANNLIYTVDGPVLIDPDNADLAPRLLDLALAAMQFHIEHESAPARMFDQDEWATFIAGYAEFVTLTPAERALWPQAVDYMLSEYGVWSLIESDEWEEAREGAFMADLARATADRFPLPA